MAGNFLRISCALGSRNGGRLMEVGSQSVRFLGSSWRGRDENNCASTTLGVGSRIMFGTKTTVRSHSCSDTTKRKVVIVPTASLHTSNILRAEVVEVEGPAFAESITEGDIRWLKQVGDYVAVDELVAEIETDKTTVEVPAMHAGTIREHLVPDGEKVMAKQHLYKIELGGDAPPKAAPAAPPPPPTAAPEPPKPAPVSAGPIPSAMPSIPQPPSAPITSTPVAKLAPAPRTPPPPPARSAPAPPPPRPAVAPAGVALEHAITGARTETRVKMNRMRLRIAERLKDAQNTYAMLTTFNEIDMSNIIEMRKKFGDQFMKKHGVKLGFMSPFIRAAAYALQEQPVVNAVIDEQEIIYRHFVDISVAVATPRGLVVPVLRNADGMTLAAIEREMVAMGEKARDGKLAIEDMEGGSFTISNGGVFGSLFGTPIINPPQSAILGMHATNDKPAAVNGKVEIRPIMVVALTYDHRLVDGREAVTFLKKIKSAIEDPRTMLLDL